MLGWWGRGRPGWLLGQAEVPEAVGVKGDSFLRGEKIVLILFLVRKYHKTIDASNKRKDSLSLHREKNMFWKNKFCRHLMSNLNIQT